MKIKPASEHSEQVALFKWAELASGTIPELRALIAIPNGGKRNIITAVNLKREGVKPGVPDIFLAYPAHGHAGLWIELKKRVGGVVSDVQKEWHRRLFKNGYEVKICKGWEEAKYAILIYLKPQ